MFNNVMFDRVCPGGCISAQIKPEPPEDETCDYCGRDVDDCECEFNNNEDDPREDR
jgi:hypothetical protein